MFQEYLSGMLRQERVRRHMTQEQMSRLLHISRQTYCNYETGRRCPSMDMLIQIFEILKIPAEQVLTGLPAFTAQDRQLLMDFHRLAPQQRVRALELIRSMLSS
ncbi:MAG TPA: helix-turn-helix transcriptional regulator [Candidatus Pullilachnospira intestinigallinarum]|nr:helix-turn-helix transcriptional regulator [Candidatus Pullilachnospira intestinigallinarum]